MIRYNIVSFPSLPIFNASGRVAAQPVPVPVALNFSTVTFSAPLHLSPQSGLWSNKTFNTVGAAVQ